MFELKLTRVAAIVGVAGFAGLFVFQVLLAAGAPLGRAAFGGASAKLSPELRAASALSALLILGAVWTLLVRAEVISAGRRARARAGWTIWGFAALFSLSAVANFTSSSPWERFGWGPYAVLLVICCVIVGAGSLVSERVRGVGAGGAGELPAHRGRGDQGGDAGRGDEDQ